MGEDEAGEKRVLLDENNIKTGLQDQEWSRHSADGGEKKPCYMGERIHNNKNKKQHHGSRQSQDARLGAHANLMRKAG